MRVCLLSHVQHFATPWTLCIPPGFSVHGIFQARMLEGVVIFYSRGSSQPRDWTRISLISCTGRWLLHLWCHLQSPSKLMYCGHWCFKCNVQSNEDYPTYPVPGRLYTVQSAPRSAAGVQRLASPQGCRAAAFPTHFSVTGIARPW